MFFARRSAIEMDIYSTKYNTKTVEELSKPTKTILTRSIITDTMYKGVKIEPVVYSAALIRLVTNTFSRGYFKHT